ncbi:MAG: hypothetical protein ACTSU5_15955 [Promethearchaeota archaeon]
MADLSEVELKAFVETVVRRGLGLYGQEEMAKMCYDAGIALTDDNKVEWLEPGDRGKQVQDLLLNYGSRNLPAKMTAIILARQHHVPVPPQLLKKKKKRRFRFRKRSG